MTVQKNEFFECEEEKIMTIHKKYSTRDINGKVHCKECPYGLYSGCYCGCLFGNQINKKESEE